MNDIPSYKSRVINSLYNRNLAMRDATLAEISVLLEAPQQAAAEKLETQMAKLVGCTNQISMMDSMFGSASEDAEEETKD